MARFRVTHRALLAAALACTGAAAQADLLPAPDSAGAPLGEAERIRHLLARFAFGTTPADLAEVRRLGIDAWFERQLDGELAMPERLGEQLAARASLDAELRDLVARYYTTVPADAPEARRVAANRKRGIPGRENRDAVLLRATYGPRQVLETAADFCRNHLCVSADDMIVKNVVPHWERAVIRRHAFGRFGDMLVDSARHPAMLVYLDNRLSRRPATARELALIELRARRRATSMELVDEQVDLARQRGLNENYARELLELHTLGVDNGYTQADVNEVAKVFSGWTIEPQGAGFRFDRFMHCAGRKAVLGEAVYGDYQNPLREGEAVLARLARDPRTARHVALELCRHFVADQPPAATVERVAAAYLESRGDLKACYRAILRDPAFFARESYRQKFKRPFELVVSALRATGAVVEHTDGVHWLLEQLSEPIYRCPAPTGYDDRAEAWCDPGVMATRWQFALALARDGIPGVRVPDSLFEDLPADAPGEWPGRLAARVLGVAPDAGTARALDRAVEAAAQPDRALARTLLGMLLGSPEFQRQ